MALPDPASILGNVGAGITGSLDAFLDSLPNPFKTKKVPKLLGQDFSEGFTITEIVDGVDKKQSLGFGLTLLGDQMPFQPFPFGGEQKITKDYYAGNPEPVVQVLGPRESAITMKGRLKAKHFTNGSEDKSGFYGVPEAVQRQMDAIRIRGNLLRITMGSWKRYGFLQKTHFELNTLVRIEYDLTFEIIGFNPPTNCKFIDRTKEVPFQINKDLIDAALAFTANKVPATMPKTIASVLNGLIGDVAGAIGLVTNFVDTTVKTAEDVVASVNRAKGLILNARATISKFKRSVRSIGLSIENIGSTFTNKNGGLGSNVGAVLGVNNNLPTSQTKSTLTTSTYSHAAYINGAVSSTKNLSQILAALHKQFDALAASAPLLRYVVKSGDTLQKLAIKYYSNADKWNAIYDHNKLTTTVLVAGTILEIPKP